MVSSAALRQYNKEVDWDDSFILYLTSKLPNPHYGGGNAGSPRVDSSATPRLLSTLETKT